MMSILHQRDGNLRALKAFCIFFNDKQEKESNLFSFSIIISMLHDGEHIEGVFLYFSISVLRRSLVMGYCTPYVLEIQFCN